jgi:hypothetical protein
MKPTLINEMGKTRSSASGYSIGWKVVKREGNTLRLTHSGALQSYRAWMAVDLETGVSIAGGWTLAGNQKMPSMAAVLQMVIDGL